MKTSLHIIVLLVSSTFLSCDKDQSNDSFVGSTWELVAELTSENDGSEFFEPTNKQEIIKFTSINNVNTSNSWCENSELKVASYTANPNRITADCTPLEEYIYEIDGNFLYIFASCEQNCAKKYKRM
jgi:hypothetical protein